MPAATAIAEPAADTASLTVSRHYTTNVLDDPLPLSDWFTRLRGSLDWGFEHGLGETRLAVAAEVARYDTYDLEDDTSLFVSTTTTAPVADWLELRGTLSAAISDEGDALVAGAGLLATRVRQATLSAGLQAGIRLDPTTTLIFDMLTVNEDAGPTRFPGANLPPIGFQADRGRLVLTATAMRADGQLSYGAHAGLHLVRAEAAALLPAIALAQYTLKLQAALAAASGHAIGMAAGVQMLDVERPAFRQLRPTFELAATLPFGDRLSILAAASAAYDTVDSDDPVASFVRRVEAAVSFAATERLALAAGLYGERSDYVGLGGSQGVRAAFAEARWSFTRRLSARLRVESSRKQDAPLGAVTRAVETQVALTASL